MMMLRLGKSTSFLLLICSFLIFARCAPDETGDYLDVAWAKSFGGEGSEKSRSVQIGSDNSVYILGTYTDSFTVGAGTPNKTQLTPTAKGFESGFVIKYESGGSFAWATQLGGTSSGEDVFYIGSIDFKSDKLYIHGSVLSDAVFETEMGTIALEGGFIAVVSESGHLENMLPSGFSWWDRDDNGNYLAAMPFQYSPVTFETENGEIVLELEPGFIRGSYVAIYNEHGVTIDAWKFADGRMSIRDAKFCEDGVAILGRYGDFDEELIIGSQSLTSPGGTDNRFLSRFDLNGDLIFLSKAEMPSYDGLSGSLVVTQDQQLVWSVSASNDVTLVLGEPYEETADEGSFVASYDIYSGALKWVTEDAHGGTRACLLANGTIMSYGNAVRPLSTSYDNRDWEVSQLSTSGEILGYAKDVPQGYDFDCLPDSTFAIVGIHGGGLRYGSMPGEVFQSNGETDVFVVVYRPPVQ